MFHNQVKLRLFIIAWPMVKLSLVLSGCSGNGGNLTEPINVQDGLTAERGSTSNRVLWGIWEFDFDQATWEVKVIPIRNAHPTST